MPVISFTPADALQTVTVPAATYGAELVKIEGPKPSSSGKSVSFFVDMQITQEGKFKGKEFTIALNSETSNASLLGTMQFFPQSTFLEIDGAIQNKPVEPLNVDLDTDELLHKPLDIIVGVATVEGKLINIINGFLPAGSGKSGPGW